MFYSSVCDTIYDHRQQFQCFRRLLSKVRESLQCIFTLLISDNYSCSIISYLICKHYRVVVINWLMPPSLVTPYYNQSRPRTSPLSVQKTCSPTVLHQSWAFYNRIVNSSPAWLYSLVFRPSGPSSVITFAPRPSDLSTHPTLYFDLTKSRPLRRLTYCHTRKVYLTEPEVRTELMTDWHNEPINPLVGWTRFR